MQLIRNLFFSICFFLLFFWSETGAYAQNTLIFKNINVDNGLPQNTVLSVLQDDKGYMWFGTYDGLSKFNGLDFTIYKNDANDATSISNNKINKIFKDHAGRIWVGTVNGINVFDPLKDNFRRFTLQHSDSNYIVLSIAQDVFNIIWVGTNKGLFFIDPKSKSGPPGELTRSALCGNNKVECLYVDTHQNLWIGNGKSLKIYNPAQKKLGAVPAPLLENNSFSGTVVRCIIQDRHHNFLIGTEAKGLIYYNVESGICTNYNQMNGILSNTVRALLEIDDQVIWAGTKKGLNVINLKTGQIKNFINDPLNPNSLSQNSIREISIDDEHNIWLGTFNGGVNCVYNQFDNFYYMGLKKGGKNNLSYNVVNSIFQDKLGDFWMGTDDGGLNHVDSALQLNSSYYQYNGVMRELLGNSVKRIAQNTTDATKLWIGTGNGLTVFDKTTKTFCDTHILPKPTESGVIQNLVLLNDENGLWVGTNFSGLYFLSKSGSLKSFQMSDNKISALLKTGDNLWVGTTNNGLDRLNVKLNQIVHYPANIEKPYALTSNAILSICKDKKGRLWIGTDGGGLNYFDTKNNQFYCIDEEKGIANNTIHEILEDSRGRLWLSTNKGISSVDLKRFAVPFNKSDLVIANYSVEDGLQSNQFSNGAALKAANGKLIFGGINGITVFDPDKIKVNRVKPNIVFTDFLIFNKSVSFKTESSPLQKPIDETTEISLNHNQTSFTIKFAALNYIAPHKNSYAFKLDGFSDSEWHYLTDEQSATYTNLDAGTYYFKIKAANNDGVWNNTPRVLKIIILPPWYKTFYAYGVYLALVIYLLYLFNIYSKRTERLKTELAFESINHAKDQELARNQLSFFVNISHEIKTPLTMILAPIERMMTDEVSYIQIKQQLGIIRRNGNKLMHLVNQLLDKKQLDAGQMHLEVTENNIIPFVEEIMVAFACLATGKNMTIKLIKNTEEINLWFDVDKLEKIFFNLLSNAIKFGKNFGEIVISIYKDADNGWVLIKVEDDGYGIAPNKINKIFTQFYHEDHNLKIEGNGLGLAFSKQLVELHYGEISVESQEQTSHQNGFARFLIKIYLGNTHFKQNELATRSVDGEDILNYQEIDQNIQAKLALKKIEIRGKESRDSLMILLIEDNEDVLQFLKDGFSADFDVHTATNGLTGLATAKKIIPDIIVTDVMMPVLNGIELCVKLKSDLETSHIPIILLTARTQFIFKMEGIETGADDYITKPFSMSLLEHRVWNLLENRQKLRLRYQKEIKLDPQNIAITSLDELFLNKILNFIELNIGDPDLSIEQLIQETAMGRTSFYKKIKSLTGQTGIEFIRTIRIKRAAQLLIGGQLTVNEVAYMVGFLDVNYFRKCFKEHFNYSPREHAGYNEPYPN